MNETLQSIYVVVYLNLNENKGSTVLESIAWLLALESHQIYASLIHV